MAFAIQITEVGPAEFPLIQTLREAVFSEFGHTSRTSIADSLAGHQDLLVLMAHLEGNPVGFAAGYRRNPELYYLNYLGVLRDYRRQGLGKSMLQQQVDFAMARGYRRMEFNTFNHFPWMLRLGLSAGFLPVGLTQHEGTHWDLAIRFTKNLKGDGDQQTTNTAVDLESDELICPSDNSAALRRALDAGFQFHGMIHQHGHKQPSMILHRIRK
jgi:GNAT superfamily N-acetyltransferase